MSNPVDTLKQVTLKEIKLWYSEGVLWVHKFHNIEGKIEGEFRSWHRNGKLERRDFWKNGKEYGEHKRWYEDGQLKIQKFYQAGKMEGEYKSWYNNGQLWTREFYHDGQLEGERKIWYSNGQSYVQEFYRNGILDGLQKSWFKNGNPAWLEYRNRGSLEGERKRFFEDGKLLERTYYFCGPIDRRFTLRKKIIFIKIQSSHLRRPISTLNSFLISDLVPIIARFIAE